MGAVNGKRFVEYARAVTSALDEISEATIKDSYKQFLCNLEEYLNQNADTDIKKFSSMKTFSDFLDSR